MKLCNCGNYRIGPLTANQCRECWFYHNNQKAREHFDALAAGKPSPFAQPHLNKPLSEGDRPQPQPPPYWKRVANYAKAAKKHAWDFLVNVDQATYDARLAVCRGCIEWYNSETKLCCHPNCGCPVEAKAAWRSEPCPLRKWPGDDQPAAAVGKCGGCPGAQGSQSPPPPTSPPPAAG
jgi:hypothetical protein